ncbi:MAG: glycosyltransferase [Paracoccaceae bacterium]
MAGAGEHVTIVMATLNGAAYLPEQLQSLAAQSHADWSLFVSDDGSGDATRAILRDFGRRHRVHLVDGPGTVGQGGGAAANFLSALCHADLPAGIVALADQDDVWLPGKLARGLRRMAAAPGTGPLLYAAESALADRRLRPLRLTTAGRAEPGFAAALGQNLFGGHTTMLNPAALALVRAAGPVAGIAFHDWWIYQLLAGAGARLVLDPAATALYRQHGGNVMGAARGPMQGVARLGRVLDGRWKAEMQAQAGALASVAHLLTPAARQTLERFLAAPDRGMARVRRFRQLGIRRSSARGNVLMLGAAFAGLL